MEKVSFDNLDLGTGVENTYSLSNVTVRKHKKSQRNATVNDTSNTAVVENTSSDPSLATDDQTKSTKSKHDYINVLFGVSLKTMKDIDDFTKGCEDGTYSVWNELESDVRTMVMEAVCGLAEVFIAKSTTTKPTHESPIVQVDSVCDGVNVSIPRRVVEKVSARLEYTLYGYFIGNRMAFPVVEYYVRNNWAKYGLKKIMLNAKGFFFFKFDTQAGLEAVLEDGPWLIRKSPIILKKWSIDTRLCKEELTRIPVWVKLHDVPIQVFEDDGINLIASFLGKPIMLDSYTSSMCKDSWGRSSFARCLIEICSEAELVEVITVGVPSLIGDGFTKETIRVEYEWRPPRCTSCKIFGHTQDHCPKTMASPPVVSTPSVATPAEPPNDGFQKVNHKKKKGKAHSSNVTQVGISVKPNLRYEPKKTTSEPNKRVTNRNNVPTSSSMLKSKGLSSKESDITTSNPYAALATDEGGDEDFVVNEFDESANLFPHSNNDGGPSYTAAVG